MAKNGLPLAMPNPSVGAILVHKNTIIAEGFTSPYGGAHAEVNCIAFAKANTPELIADSTLYVSLEPCSHYGKTPPCADLVIKSGIKKVIIGTVDSNTKVAGNGIKKLLEAGVDVTIGICEEECLELNKRFFTYHTKKRPYIILKWAESKDGFIAPIHKAAQKPVWITSTYSRQLVHKWRSEEQAILVGANTVIADNPSLTTRDWEGKSPMRIVLDIQGSLPEDAAVFNKAAKTTRLTTNKPKDICDSLYEERIQSVLVEGGAKTLQRFIDDELWDEARVFTGPVLFTEGVAAPKLGKSATQSKTTTLQEDSLIIYKNNTP